MTARPLSVLRPVCAIAVAVAIAVTSAPTAAAAPTSLAFIEPYDMGPTAAPNVETTYVTVSAPLGPSGIAIPDACQNLGYLRVKSGSGPDDPEKSDAVLITQPGVYEGAGMLAPFASNTVRAAALQGRNIEVWVIDRRANCLEDPTGLERAKQNNDPDAAAQYYLQDNARIEAPLDPDIAVTSLLGIEQTLRDQQVITDQLPEQFRSSKLFCGGHSLGALIAGAQANRLDVNGALAAPCAGYFSLDSRFATTGSALFDAIDSLGIGLNALTPATGVLPTIPLLNRALGLAASIASAADLAPDAESTIVGTIPDDLLNELLAQALISPTVVDFLRAEPDISRTRITNAALLGLVLDDNTQPLGYLRSSIGGFGTPADLKNLVLPAQLPQIYTGLVGGNTMVAPVATDGPIAWLPYDRIPTSGLQTRDGITYTTPDSEVTDIRQLASLMANPVVDGIEWNFPLRLLLELLALNSGDRTADLQNFAPVLTMPDRPILYLDGADSGFADGLQQANAPTDGRTIAVTGYNHLDVCTAAWTQTRPEPVSAAIVGELIAPTLDW